LKAELALELTEKQAQARQHDETQRQIDRQKEVLDEFIVKLETFLQRENRRVDFWKQRNEHGQRLLDRFRDSGRTCLIRRLERFVEFTGTQVTYWTEMAKLTSDKLDMAIAERDDLLGVVEADQAAIRAEMNAEMQEGNVNDFITGNIGFSTESASNEIPLMWTATQRD